MKLVLYALTSFAITALLLYFFTHGFTVYDEGWIANLALRFFHGQVPYKDFELVYTPGVMYVTSIGYHLLGLSIWAERMVAFVNSLISVGLLVGISRKLKLQTISSILIVGIYLAWGPTHLNFVWPVMFNITAVLAMIYLLMEWNTKKDITFMLFAGLFAGISLLFKQNFGAAGILIFLVFLYSNKELRNFRAITQFAIGFIAVVAAQILYFLHTNSLNSFISDFNFIFIQKILHEGATVSPLPWSYSSNIISKIGKALFYGLPLIVSLASAILIFKKDKRLLFIPSFSLIFWVVSIRPTTDIVHLAPLLAISGIPLALLFAGKDLKIKLSALFLGIILIFLGFYTALFTNYYRWEPNIVNDKYFLNSPHGHIYVEKSYFELINGVTDFVNKNSKSGDYIYAYLFSPAFYMLTDRNSPVHYDYISPGLFTPEIERQTISDLKTKKVKIIITDVPMYQDKTSVGKYIKSNYKNVKYFGKFGVWIKSVE